MSENPLPLASSLSPGARLLFTLDEAAKALAVSRRSLERLIARGEFPPPLKVGGASRVSGDDIAKYLAKLDQKRTVKIKM